MENTRISSMELLSSSFTTPLPRSPLADSIAEHLESLSIKLYDVLYRTKEFDDPVLDRLSKDFKTVQQDDGRVRDWATCLHQLRSGNSRFMQKEVLDISTDVDELKGRAKVWMTLRVHYHCETPANVCVTALDWARRGQRWMCVKRTAVRGLENFF